MKKLLSVVFILGFLVAINTQGNSATYWNSIDLDCCENGDYECLPTAIIKAPKKISN